MTHCLTSRSTSLQRISASSPALRRRKQDRHELAEGIDIIAECAQQPDDFVILQHSVAGFLLGRCLQSGNWAGLDNPALHTPIEQLADVRKDAVGLIGRYEIGRA